MFCFCRGTVGFSFNARTPARVRWQRLSAAEVLLGPTPNGMITVTKVSGVLFFICAFGVEANGDAGLS